MHFQRKLINRGITLVLITFFQVVNSQTVEYSDYDAKLDIPFFYYDVVNYPLETRDSIRMEILIKIPFDAIQFIKQKSEFIGKYEVSILLVDGGGVQTVSKILPRELRTDSFAKTKSREHFDIVKLNFKVLPDDYILTIGVLDLDTRKSKHEEKKIKLKDFYKDPVIISRISTEERVVKTTDGKLERIPSISDEISDVDTMFYITFDVLSDGGEGKIKYVILDLEGNSVIEKAVEKKFGKGISHETIKISKEGLRFDRYKIKMYVTVDDFTAEREREFQFKWIGMSNVIGNLDDAIRQLKYIASSKEIKEMAKGNLDEKKRKFMDFWKERDPVPETERNELMEEYYRRVRYANEHFSGYQEGWKTDMGMIFILFGPPSNIERHPFEIDYKPYEIWYYYELNREFVFVDETGFGEYRLVSPIYDLHGIY